MTPPTDAELLVSARTDAGAFRELYDRVADRLGTSSAAARVRVHRGLAALRNRLAPRSAR
jgi:DNA-directed RNA polymerase specialized sigma24 family protein